MKQIKLASLKYKDIDIDRQKRSLKNKNPERERTTTLVPALVPNGTNMHPKKCAKVVSSKHIMKRSLKQQLLKYLPYFTPTYFDLQLYRSIKQTNRSQPSKGGRAPLPPGRQVDAVDRRQKGRVELKLCQQ